MRERHVICWKQASVKNRIAFVGSCVFGFVVSITDRVSKSECSKNRVLLDFGNFIRINCVICVENCCTFVDLSQVSNLH